MSETALKKIRLYGRLGVKFGREFHLAVSNAAEAVRALCIVIPGFEQHLAAPGVEYAVFVDKDNLSPARLREPVGRSGTIRIAPIPQGAGGNAGALITSVGVGLIVAGFFTGGLTVPMGMAMIMGGGALAIAGAMLMLMPQTAEVGASDGPNNRPSYGFNGPVNTTAQGGCVPLLYGRLPVGSAVISGGVYAEERA